MVNLVTMTIRGAYDFVYRLADGMTERELLISERVITEITNRLKFLLDVGLEYITLNRKAGTLSGGEAQRIRLASQVGSRLTGILYVLDEPTIGLHQRDTQKLIQTLHSLRDIGNTIIVVEHDPETIMSADHLVDIGPGAGRHGGEIILSDALAKALKETQRSETIQYLTGLKKINLPKSRRKSRRGFVKVIGAQTNNLKNIDVTVPLGLFVCVTGVSGSGKSSLVNETLGKGIAKHLHLHDAMPGKHARIEGLENINKMIVIDQSPIGRTPRSNPATYTGTFTHIRDLFTALPEARVRGYRPGRFSFNVPGGRCEACEGDGVVKIEMHFLPDVYVPCEVCQGRRFSRETLEVKYKNQSVADVLDMTVAEASEFFGNIPSVADRLKTLVEVGLGYIKLGQPATTLSGGEAQRVKLSTELSKRATGQTLYILDEPTVGLHFADVKQLIEVLQKLVSHGNTVLVIEHNLDVIKTADWIIDLGPEGGEKGGRVIATGTPEEIAQNERSYTGQFLKKVLK
jgi:excinuclease ABC subunit A